MTDGGLVVFVANGPFSYRYSVLDHVTMAVFCSSFSCEYYTCRRTVSLAEPSRMRKSKFYATYHPKNGMRCDLLRDSCTHRCLVLVSQHA